ncbi:MAG TPA: hypothetical protein VK447_01830 [Myxococcaceae bacterium]|nr:hypothetical protein [Myxococcaceae bacterium]
MSREQVCDSVEVDATQPPPEHWGVVTVRDRVPEVEQVSAEVQALQAP